MESIPIVDVTVRKALKLKNVSTLSDHNVNEFVKIITEWFGDYYKIVSRPSGRRRLARRRDARSIYYEITFVKQ